MFGDGAGDQILKGSSDATDVTNLTLSMPIVYYKNEELQIYVSTHEKNKF